MCEKTYEVWCVSKKETRKKSPKFKACNEEQAATQWAILCNSKSTTASVPPANRSRVSVALKNDSQISRFNVRSEYTLDHLLEKIKK